MLFAHLYSSRQEAALWAKTGLVNNLATNPTFMSNANTWKNNIQVKILTKQINNITPHTQGDNRDRCDESFCILSSSLTKNI